MATVELKRWTFQHGIEWSQIIDLIEDNTTASEYIRACEANMDEPWWNDRDDDTNYFVEIYGDEYSGAWVDDILD